MNYKYSNNKKISNKTDVHLIGIYEDMKLHNLENFASTDVASGIKKIIKKCNFLGKLGDQRTFDHPDTGQQLILFGLGDKKKFGPLTVKRVLTDIIKKILKTNLTSLSLDIDNIIDND